MKKSSHEYHNVAFQNQANFGVKLLHIADSLLFGALRVVFLMLFCWGVFIDVKTMMLPFIIIVACTLTSYFSCRSFRKYRRVRETTRRRSLNPPRFYYLSSALEGF